MVNFKAGNIRVTDNNRKLYPVFFQRSVVISSTEPPVYRCIMHLNLEQLFTLERGGDWKNPTKYLPRGVSTLLTLNSLFEIQNLPWPNMREIPVLGKYLLGKQDKSIQYPDLFYL